jgi:hypothetical protein
MDLDHEPDMLVLRNHPRKKMWPSFIRTKPSAPEFHRVMRASTLAGFTAGRESDDFYRSFYRLYPAPKVMYKKLYYNFWAYVDCQGMFGNFGIATPFIWRIPV